MAQSINYVKRTCVLKNYGIKMRNSVISACKLATNLFFLPLSALLGLRVLAFVCGQ